MQDAELEELRRRKMAQLQQSQESQLQQQAMMEERAKQMEAERQAIMRQLLTPEARERLAKVRMAYPDVAAAVEEQLIRLMQMGRIQNQIDDATLKAILRQISPQRREIKIERV
ncbi:DNA-binding protein [Candidatus Methanomassiliicoccus intestinalis]|uniref:DNA-binding protein n=1 Tax=Candidatus Methanomassiliicoccus intestinalis TaxID=1406512 RepID=UPI0037DC2787